MTRVEVNLVIVQVAKRPIHTILACILLTLLSTIGFLNFTPKTDTTSLWIPAGSVGSLLLYKHFLILFSFPFSFLFLLIPPVTGNKGQF
jgi:hypothetical protein